MENLPYTSSAGTLESMLEKIKSAPAPDRFTQDFVSTKLLMKGGSARSCIPFLKKMGFVASDGSPTELYREYRNPQKSRGSLGKAFRKVYSRLYQMNEYMHLLNDAETKHLIVECTGDSKDSSATRLTLATLNTLKRNSDFDMPTSEAESESITEPQQFSAIANNLVPSASPNMISDNKKGINLSYTINLNLPPTKDIEVFNAIFKSLKVHLLEN